MRFLLFTIGLILSLSAIGWATNAVTPTPTPVVVMPQIHATVTPPLMPTIDPALGIIDPSVFTPTTDFPTVIDGAIGPVSFGVGVNPLTGLSVPDPAVLNRRPLIVKISNAPPLVRPQAGLSLADLVYEHYTEGGLTRFSAIFYSETPERVGSIRSARLIDYELTEMYKGLLAFSGASGGVEQRLNESEFRDRLYKGVAYGLPYYWRDETIEVPHNLFSNGAALWQLASTQGYGVRPLLRGMAFLPTIPPNPTGSGVRADVRYRATRVIWTYDPISGRYGRVADGKPHFDALTDRLITAANVVIIYAGHYLTDIIESEWQGSVTYSTQITLGPKVGRSCCATVNATRGHGYAPVGRICWACERMTVNFCI